MSKTHTIITIGRQFGSGGREIGKRLADELGIEFYDKELLSRAAKDSKICKELFETHDEKPTNSFLYSLVMDTYSMGFASGSVNEMPLNHKIFLAQFDAIKKIAEEGPCVLVGRCADYIFRDHRNVLNIYIYAPVDARYKNCVEVLKMKPEEATKMIYKVDKARTAYHKRYAKYAPGDPDSKQIMIDSSMLGVRGTAEILAEIVQKRFGL